MSTRNPRLLLALRLSKMDPDEIIGTPRNKLEEFAKTLGSSCDNIETLGHETLVERVMDQADVILRRQLYNRV